MLIDWFTVIAQVVNFLILVWLMKRFLYQPILHAIDEREKRIAAERASADQQKAEAQQENEKFQHKNAKFDQQRATLLRQVTEEAQTEGQRLLDEARQAAVALAAKQQEMLASEEQHLHQAISHRTQQEVFAIARKTLSDLADASLEERMVAVFIRRLGELNAEDKGRLIATRKAASDPVIVRTTFDLSPAQSTATEETIKNIIGSETHIQFETAPNLISGIELTTNGQKVGWSIADYLSVLEMGVEEQLQEQRKTIIKSKAKPEVNTAPTPEAQTKPTVENKTRGKAKPVKPAVNIAAKPKPAVKTSTTRKAQS